MVSPSPRNRRANEAKEAYGAVTSRTSVRGRDYYFSTRDLVLIAVVSAAGGVLSTYVGYLGNLLNKAFGVPFGAGQWMAGLHVFWFVLMRVAVGRTGAGTLAGVIKGVVEMFTGSTHGLPIVFISAVEGLLVDVVLLPFRRPSLPALCLAGGVASASNVLVFQALYFSGVSWGYIALMTLFAFGSGVVFGGYFADGVLAILEEARIIRLKAKSSAAGMPPSRTQGPAASTGAPEANAPGAAAMAPTASGAPTAAGAAAGTGAEAWGAAGTRARARAEVEPIARRSSRRSSKTRLALTLLMSLALAGGAVYYYVEVFEPFWTDPTCSVEGKVANPYVYRPADFENEAVTVMAELKGQVTYVPPTEYTGVPLARIIEKARPDVSAARVRVLASDGYEAEFGLDDIMKNRAVILVRDAENLRLIATGYEGGCWVRMVTRLVVE